MNVSVVVCAKEEEKYIEDCLKRLKNQTVKPEIIVVDGHSKDKTVEIARKYADKVVFDNKEGIADARNVGWQASNGDIIAYCDADSLPTEDWVEKITKLMGNNLCVYGPIIPVGAKTKVRFGLKVWGDLFLQAASVFKYPCICAANVAFKKNALKKCSFKEKVIEDFDIGNRMRKIGRLKFHRKLYMPISSRRFKNGFHRMAFKYYFMNFVRLKLDRKMRPYEDWV